MKVKILIVEDEVLVAEDIADDLTLEGYEVCGIAISSDEVFEQIESNSPHLILMDIQIKGDRDGIEIAEIINKKMDVPIIYVTSNTSGKYISRALETKPHAFLSKPYQLKDLVVAIELAISRYNEQALYNTGKLDSIFVKNGEFHRKIALNEILFIEADGSYSKVITTDTSYTLSHNLNYFNNKVHTTVLMRVHRSFIVNLQKVDGFDKNSLLIEQHIIPVSSSYKDLVFEKFTKL